MKTPGTEVQGQTPSLAPLLGPGRPLNSDAQALDAAGFVEQEYVLSGWASRYRLPDPQRDAECVDGTHPYATRMLVRRPQKPERFNGTVVLEWLNVSAGQDIDFVYAATRELLLRQGYAWVGVSAQRVGVERLVTWNSGRYAALTVSAPQTDPESGDALDPAIALTGAAGGDVLCWDLYTQAAQTVRREAAALFEGRTVARIVAAGESQSAFRLSRYFNSIQPLHEACDGFLLYDRGGPMALRADVSAKVISIGTEFMTAHLGAPSPADSDNQRWWELAGSSHTSLQEIEGYVDPQVRRDGGMVLDGRPVGLTDVLVRESGEPDLPLWSKVPNADLVKAALGALTRWLDAGVVPASAPRLAVDAQGRLVRDGEGRVLGGIRYAAYDAPSAINVGVTETGCRLAGYHIDFTPQQWRQRYGDAATYLARVNTIVNANVAEGFLLAEDGERVIQEARRRAYSFDGAA
jgi:Alpha/beta hydrolase domain